MFRAVISTETSKLTRLPKIRCIVRFARRRSTISRDPVLRSSRRVGKHFEPSPGPNYEYGNVRSIRGTFLERSKSLNVKDPRGISGTVDRYDALFFVSRRSFRRDRFQKLSRHSSPSTNESKFPEVNEYSTDRVRTTAANSIRSAKPAKDLLSKW